MFGAILKVTNSSFQKGMAVCRSIYVKRVMKLLAFIFEQPSYIGIASMRQFQCVPTTYVTEINKTYLKYTFIKNHVH